MSAQTQKIVTIDDVQNMIAKSRKGSTTASAEGILERILSRVANKKEEQMPAPLGINTTIQEQKEALELSYDTDSLVVRFVRRGPSISTTVDESGKKKHTIANGAPHACLVAFMKDNKLYVGWSKHNASMIAENGAVIPRALIGHVEGNIRPLEDKPFTKEHARYTAILRGLVDSIVIQGKEIRSGNSNKVIPSCISRELTTFVARARKRFKTNKVVNLVGNI